MGKIKNLTLFSPARWFLVLQYNLDSATKNEAQMFSSKTLKYQGELNTLLSGQTRGHCMYL